MRRLLIVVGILVAVLIAGAVVFIATFNVNRYRATMQSELEQRLARKVTLGEMHLNVFPPRFKVQDLAIADDSHFSAQKPFIQTQQLDISFRLLALLKGDVEIYSLDLQHPSIELIKNTEGVWNFASLGDPPETRETSGQFSLKRLTISDGQVAVTDLQHQAPRALYDHIDAIIQDFASNQPFSVDAAVHLPGSGRQQVRLQGQVGPIVQGQPTSTPFHGSLEMQQVGIASLQKFLDSPALVNTDGVLSGQTKIGNESGKLTVSGQMNVQNAKVHGLDLGYPISTEYDIADDLPGDMITIRNTTINLGTMPIVLTGTVNTKPTPSQVDLQIKANNISIAEAAKLASASGLAFSPGTTVTGNMNADIQARGTADKPALSGTVSGRDVRIRGENIPQPVYMKLVNLAFTPTEIHSDNFNVTSGGTSVAIQFALRQYLSRTPLVDATLRAPNAALTEVLSMARAYGVTGLDKISGAGTLSMDLHAAGPVQKLTSAELTKALNGTLKVSFHDVRYAGSDIGYQLASIGGFLKPSEKDQGFTNISRMTGNIVVQNGIAQSNDLLAQLDIGNVGVAGTANLVTEALDLRATAVLSRDFSQRAGGTGIGGYMSTVLANNQGELVIPAIVSGTFENPKFSPDLQKVAQMKLKGLLPNLSNPSAGVAGALGGLLGQKGGNQAQQQAPQQQQTNPVQQLIDIFGGKKKQEQQPAQK